MATFVEEIRARSFAAAREKDAVAKDVFRLALGEIQNAEVRGATIDDAAAVLIVRKLVKSIAETMGMTADEAQKAQLARETEVLQSLLPKSMDEGAIAAALGPVAEAIKAAKSDGQAMGVAMKTLKASGQNAEAADVTRAIAKIRS